MIHSLARQPATPVTAAEPARRDVPAVSLATVAQPPLSGGGPRTAAEVLALQRRLGNRAVQRLLRGAGPEPATAQSGLANREVVRRRVEQYQDKTGAKDMAKLAATLDGNVDTAKKVVDANPLLTGVDGRDKGYLGAWVTTFTEFTADKDGNVPPFFYARYGYAIETLATALFKAGDHGDYKVDSQVTQGSTRPDFVVRDKKGNELAWLDVTSADSKGHIYAKQGGGWKARPYVAEILYAMPAPTDFATTATGTLTKEQVEALKKADTKRAERELQFDKGMRAMGLLLGEALAAKYKTKGDGLSKADVKGVTAAVCKTHLDKFVDGGVKPRHAAGVLASIEFIEVMGEVGTGLSWSKWAFTGVSADLATGRAILWDYGKTL